MRYTIFDTPLLSTLMRMVSIFVLRLTGWKVEGSMPPAFKKCVVIAAPHTSNWDFPNLVMVAFVLRLYYLHWMGKDSLFRFPCERVAKYFGGIPVKREKSDNFVAKYSQTIMNSSEEFYLVIAPEGTRKSTARWKTGFYYIALGAKVPIVMAYMDYQDKRAGIGKILYPSGDIESDMKEIKAFYASFKGKNPDQFSI